MSTQPPRPYDLVMFDWNGTLSSGLVAQEERSVGQITALFPGVKEVLKTLKSRGIKIGIATAASRFEMSYEISSHELEGLFDCVYTLTEGPAKPDPYALIEAMTLLEISPQRTLMVGDTRRDMQMARNARVTGIGVSYGSHHADELREAGALHVISEIQELLDLC